MSNPVTPSQFIVKCKGSSQPYVKSYRPNAQNPDHLDLFLGGGSMLSDNPKDYTVHLGTAEQIVVGVEGKVLTIELL